MSNSTEVSMDVDQCFLSFYYRLSLKLAVLNEAGEKARVNLNYL